MVNIAGVINIDGGTDDMISMASFVNNVLNNEVYIVHNSRRRTIARGARVLLTGAILLLAGTINGACVTVEAYPPGEGNWGSAAGSSAAYSEPAVAPDEAPRVRERRITLYDGVGIVQIARRYLGTPYRFGGNTPAGFDCSGYVQYVYKRAGYKVSHGARSQYSELRPIKAPQVGDLVFFRTTSSGISHVGIYAGNFRFLHSPRTGKTVEYADMRIKYWKTRYAGARTVFRYF